MKPIPLSDDQINKIIKNLEQDIQDAWKLFLNFENTEEIYVNDELLTGISKNEFLDKLKKMLGVQIVGENIVLYRKVNLMCYKNGFLELLEATNSGSLVKFKDGRGAIGQIPTDYYKRSKEKPEKSKPKKPTKSRLGQSALKKLSGSGG